VVDDSSYNLFVMQTLLAEIPNLDFVTANNGLDAVEACRERGFDIILMDIHMPIMDGVQV